MWIISDDASAGDRDSADDGKCRNNTEYRREKCALCAGTGGLGKSLCVGDGNNAFTAWPGEEMEADAANDGWYYIWLPAWANHVIINANEGNVQTEEQILDTNAAWITVSAADTVEISYESKTTGEAPAYVEKFVVHAKVDDSWDTPCLWAWSAPDGTNAFAAWPGEAMKAGEDGW